MREDESIRTIEELREAVRARDEFLAIAAHELRNPMHALLLQVTTAVMAAERVGNADLVQRLQRVKSVVDRYVQRATTLLDVSRINAGQLQLRREPCDLAAIVRQVAESYAAEADFNGTSLSVSGPETLMGEWDRTAVEHIVANLVSNAIKYGDGQPVEIAFAREDSLACLIVRDHGIGISAADQARVFGRFEQAIGSGGRSGFGIGLWLVRALVDAHEGSIEVDSTKGEGATFTLRLPFEGPATEVAS